MKKKLSYITAAVFAATLLLNISAFLGKANAYVYAEKGPIVENCTYKGNVYAYASSCTGQGTIDCVDTNCPPPPQD